LGSLASHRLQEGPIGQVFLVRGTSARGLETREQKYDVTHSGRAVEQKQHRPPNKQILVSKQILLNKLHPLCSCEQHRSLRVQSNTAEWRQWDPFPGHSRMKYRAVKTNAKRGKDPVVWSCRVGQQQKRVRQRRHHNQQGP
jgi:hypothetical protein